jgi:hypothetical protein
MTKANETILTRFYSVSVFLLMLLCAALVQPARAQELTYTFENATLSGPKTIAVNGFRDISFVNNSDTELDMSVAKLHDGATRQNYISVDKAINDAFSAEEGDARQPIGELISLADLVGGVHLPSDTQGSAYIKLEPGRYLLTAASGGGPGDPYRPTYLEVTVTEGERAEAPTADFSLHMVDFHFDFPETMRAGEQLWEVSNTGSQPHFALIFRLLEGKAAEDVTTWMTDFSGPPPVDFEGGAFIQAVTSGQTYYTPVNLTPGTYVAVCPLPNLATGEPHFVDGMASTFTVQ